MSFEALEMKGVKALCRHLYSTFSANATDLLSFCEALIRNRRSNDDIVPFYRDFSGFCRLTDALFSLTATTIKDYDDCYCCSRANTNCNYQSYFWWTFRNTSIVIGAIRLVISVTIVFTAGLVTSRVVWIWGITSSLIGTITRRYNILSDSRL